MKSSILSKKDIYCGNLILVNERYSFKNLTKENLVPADSRTPSILIKKDASNILELILEKIGARGKIIPVSGYRTFDEQNDIFEDSLKENGEDFTKKYVALPGHSEHQTGLAIDLGLNKEKIDFIRPGFPSEGICGTFRTAAPDYGFILRYPAGKERITGIFHEPWHFRYVGTPHSKIIEENGMSLEEYIKFIKNYGFDNRYVFSHNNSNAEIYYTPASGNETEIFLPEKAVTQVSGNNIDGFIITVWRNTANE